MRKGPAVTDEPAGSSAPGPDTGATTRLPRPAADDFQPDVPHDVRGGRSRRPGDRCGQHRQRVGVRPPARRLRRRSHPGTDRLRRAARAADRGRHLRRGRPPDPRCHHRRGPLPAAGLPRRTAEPAVLAGTGHRAGPPGRADVRRPGRHAARRRGAGDSVPHAETEPHRHARRRPGARRRQHRIRRSGGVGVDPRRLAGGGGRHLTVADRRCPRHPVTGRRRRGRPPLRCRAVDRPPQPGAGQHRGRRGARLPRDAARRHPRGRHPRDRGGAVRAADQPVAAAGVRCAQRAGTRRARRRRPAHRAPGGRPRYPVPDLGGRGPRRPGRWRHPHRPDPAESAAAGHRDRRPDRADFPGRRTRGAGAAAAFPRGRRPGSRGPPPKGADGRVGRGRCDHPRRAASCWPRY